MKILTFALLLLSLSAGAQVTLDSLGNREGVFMTPDYARNVEYWGQKGLSAEIGIPLLEYRIKALDDQIELYKTVNKNALYQAEQYRQQLQSTAAASFQLQKDIASIKEDRDAWKLKAKTRSWIIGGAVAFVAMIGYIQITK